MSESTATAIYWVIILLLGAVGYWLQSTVIAEIEARRRARGWFQTTGRVNASHIESLLGAKQRVPGRLLKKRADIYKPVISYNYQVDGKSYHSSRYQSSFVAQGEEWAATNLQAAENILAEHPPGKNVTVTYDPGDPALAYLVVDTSLAPLLIFRISGVVLILVAALMFMRSAFVNSNDIFSGRTFQESAAVIPVPSAEIRAGLAEDLGLICKYHRIYQETYESWLCNDPASPETALVFLYSRKQALDKSDYLSATADQARAPALFADLLKVALPQADPIILQEWVAKTTPLLGPNGAKAETSIQEVPFVLSILDGKLQLDMGEFKY